MNIQKLLQEANQEREAIEGVIRAVNHLAAVRVGGGKRGRPPAWLKSSGVGASGKRRGRPPGSKNKPK